MTPRSAALVTLLCLAGTGCQTLEAWRAALPVFAVDAAGDPEAGASLSVERPSDLVPPDGLRVTSNTNRRIALAWDPVLVGDVAGYAVLRAFESTGPWQLAGRTASRFATLFSDYGGEAGLGDGVGVFYRVHPFDSQARLSRSHAFVSARTAEPPAAPTGVGAFSNLPRRVVVSWQPSHDSSVAGYAVYRSPTRAGPWQRLEHPEGRLRTQHDDPVPGDLRVMHYRVTAYNRFGAEGPQSDPVRALTKPEPLPPYGLELESRALGRVGLRWEPNVERDIVTYEVWRGRYGPRGWLDAERIAQVEAGVQRYVDTDVGCAERVRYALRAVDADGLASESSDPLEVRGADLGLAVVAADADHWELRWQPEQLVGAHALEVARERRWLPPQTLARLRDAAALRFASAELGDASLRVTPVDAKGEPAGPRCSVRVPAREPAHAAAAHP